MAQRDCHGGCQRSTVDGAGKVPAPWSRDERLLRKDGGSASSAEISGPVPVVEFGADVTGTGARC